MHPQQITTSPRDCYIIRCSDGLSMRDIIDGVTYWTSLEDDIPDKEWKDWLQFLEDQLPAHYKNGYTEADYRKMEQITRDSDGHIKTFKNIEGLYDDSEKEIL